MRKFDQNLTEIRSKRRHTPLIWESYQKWSTLHIFWITICHVICYFWRIVNWSSIFGWVEITLGLLNFRCWNILRLFMFVLDVFWIEDDPAHDGNSNIVFGSMQKNFYFVKIHQKSKEKQVGRQHIILHPLLVPFFQQTEHQTLLWTIYTWPLTFLSLRIAFVFSWIRSFF